MTSSALTPEQERLVAIETRMRALDPLGAAYWKLKSERNALRAATDRRWRDEHDFGTRAGRWAPLPWPRDTKGRWRALRELIEAYWVVPVGDVVTATYRSAPLAELTKRYGRLGASVRQWVALTDELKGLQKTVFRDAPHLGPIRDVFLSVMTQGEGDYAWVIHEDALAEEDPPVIGFVLDVADTQRFIPDEQPPAFGPYGSYRRLTDFVRAHLDAYDHADALQRAWATKPTPRSSAARLLPKRWANYLSRDEIDDVIIETFRVDGLALDEVADTESLAAAWALDADELQEMIAFALEDIGTSLGVPLDAGRATFETRAAIVAFVQGKAAGRAKRRRRPRAPEVVAPPAPTPPTFTFQPGAAGESPPPAPSELARLVARADPSYWNGASGATCLTWQHGQETRRVFASVASDGRWHVRYQFPDGSSVVAHDAARDRDPPITLVLDGQPQTVPANQFVDADMAQRVMLRFMMEHGAPHDRADWRVPR